jgi:multidrug efflux pump subunit AcrB
MTNFSLILTFGMGIDTVMVVIESAYENVKKGFEPKHAVLIAVKDYAAPLIASALANIIVFLPMIFLPGIVGKFLAYIPQTIFATLIASLFLALTINCAIFYLVTRSRRILVNDPET